MVPFFESDSLVIINSEGKINGHILTSKDGYDETYKNIFKKVVWTKDGQHLVATGRDNCLYFYNNEGKMLKKICSDLFYFSDLDYLSYNTFMNRIVSLIQLDNESWLYFFNVHGEIMDSLKLSEGDYDVGEPKFSGDGKCLFVGLSDDSIFKMNLIKIDTNPIKFMKATINYSKGDHFRFSESGNLVAVYSSIGEGRGAKETYVIRNINDFSLKKIAYRYDHPLNQVENYLFHPSDSLYVVRSSNKVFVDYVNLKKEGEIVHKKKINTLHFSPLNNYILTGGEDNVGKVSTLDCTLYFELRGHINSVTGLHLDFHQQNAFTSSKDGTLRKWDLLDFNYNTFFKDTKESIDIAFMKQFISDPAENFLFSISTQSRIGQIFNLKYHNLIKLKSEVQPNMQWLDSTHFMRIKPAPYDVRKFLYLYELRNGSIIDLFSYETDKMFSVGLMNNKIAIYCGDSIRFWDMDGNYIRAILADVFGGSVSCFSPNQSMIAFSSSRIIDKKIEPTLVVYNQIGEKMHRLESSINDFRRIKFSNKNDRLASFATDGSVQINYMNGRPMVYIPRRDCDPKIDSAIRDFHFSANDELIVSVYSDGLIRIWDSTANLTNSFQSNLTLQDANFTPDGKLIYGYDADTTLNLWDLQGNLIYTYNGHNAYFTPDGNRLYTIKNHKNKDSELRDYLTPQGAYNYFKSNKTFQKPSDNSLYGKWLKLLEWLGLS
jgi:WD40 repeat protein